MFRPAALSLLSPQPAPSHLLGRIGRTVMACAALALLSACGGGDRAEEYQPDRVVVFGDENSAFASYDMGGNNNIRGLVYTINAVGPLVSGAYTRYCTDVSTPLDACLANFVTTGAFLSDFDATDDARPLGTGSFITPGSDLLNTPVNAVRMVGVGAVTHVVPGASPADPPVSTVRTLKRDSIVQYDCSASIIAAQRIAHTFGKGFNGLTADACPLDAKTGAKTFAVAGAKIAGLQAQVNQAIGQGLLGKGALVTVWIGQNDLIEIIEDVNASWGTLQSKRDEAKLRAERLAQVVLQIYRTGAKIIVINATDLSYSPWALNLGVPGCGAAVVPCPNVQEVVNDFNRTLFLGDLPNDSRPNATGYKGLLDLATRGRDYAFVDAAQSMRDFANGSGYIFTRGVCVGATSADSNATNRSVRPDGVPATLTNGVVTNGVLTGAQFDVQHCTTQNLFVNTGAGAYIWADDRHLAPLAHQAIANAALVRAIDRF